MKALDLSPNLNRPKLQSASLNTGTRNSCHPASTLSRRAKTLVSVYILKCELENQISVAVATFTDCSTTNSWREIRYILLATEYA